MILQTFKLILPALIPSWRFFDFIAPSPRVEFCLDGGAWLELSPPHQTQSLSQAVLKLFWNPYRNDYLYIAACAERLMHDPTHHSAQKIIDYIRTQNPNASDIQFRLVFITRDNRIVTYISDGAYDV